MKLLLLFSFLTTCLAAISNNELSILLLGENYGGQHNRRRCHWNPNTGRFRCRRNNNNAVEDELILSLTHTQPKPKTCYPDYATFERQTPDGGFEVIPVRNLTIGNKVKCLVAPLGPQTKNPELGVCEYISKNHDDVGLNPYMQINYEIDGHPGMLALSQDHILWSSRDGMLKGPVDVHKLNVSNPMFVEAEDVRAGDVIVVLDKNNVPQYRPVVSRYLATMEGVHNPNFDKGGLPIVNGVVSTTSAARTIGGHWGCYFAKIWDRDDKFANPDAVVTAYHNSDFFQGTMNGTLALDDDCFLNHLIGDMKKGVDVTNYNDFDSFYEVYLANCTHPTAADAVPNVLP